MKKLALLLLISLLLSSCFEGNLKHGVYETDVVVKIEKSNKPEFGKFWVETSTFCFHTSKNYEIGDTLTIIKR